MAACVSARLSVGPFFHPSVRPGWHPGHLFLGCGAWAGGEAALFGTVRKLEPASLLLIDIGALQWDVGPAGASADEIGGWRRGGYMGKGIVEGGVAGE